MVVTNDTTIAEIDEALATLVTEARKAHAQGNDLRYSARHRAIDTLLEDRDVLLMLTPTNP